MNLKHHITIFNEEKKTPQGKADWLAMKVFLVAIILIPILNYCNPQPKLILPDREPLWKIEETKADMREWEIYNLDENGNTVFYFGDTLKNEIQTMGAYKQPLFNKAPRKRDTGENIQKRIAHVYNTCRLGYGMTSEQAFWVVGQVDHETAGTWSETIKGDGGCSTGLGQWNSCAGSRRKAEPTFGGQTQQICREMKKKFDEFPIEIAIGKHNAPAWDKNPNYVAKVKASLENFEF